MTLLLLGLLVLNSIFLIVVLLRLFNLKREENRLERMMREEIANNRKELTQSILAFSDSLQSRISENATLQKNQLDTFSNQLSSLTQINENKLEKIREVVERNLKDLQQEIDVYLKVFNDAFSGSKIEGSWE